MQDLIDQLAFCAALGCVMSPVLAGLLSYWSRKPGVSGFLSSLLLAAVPVYLTVDFLTYEGAAMVGCALAGFVFCLYHLRGWWLAAATIPRRTTGLRRSTRKATKASALRLRAHSIIRLDRRWQQSANRPMLDNAA